MLIGCVESTKIALAKLAELQSDDLEIVGLLTKKKSEFNSDFVDLSEDCIKYRINCFYIEDFIDGEITTTWVKGLKLDVIFVVGWSKLIKKEILELPRIATFGCHPSALPANRGRHPLIWALVLGLSVTASTFYIMGEGADDGPIVSQVPINIGEHDDARVLYSKVLGAIANQITEIIDAIHKNSLIAYPQDWAKSNVWRKRTKIDGRIDWRMSSGSIYNLVRALVKPYPGAYFLHDGQEYIVWKCKVVICNEINIEPGKVLSREKNLIIKTGDGAVEIVEYEKKLLLSGDYL